MSSVCESPLTRFYQISLIAMVSVGPSSSKHSFFTKPDGTVMAHSVYQHLKAFLWRVESHISGTITGQSSLSNILRITCLFK